MSSALMKAIAITSELCSKEFSPAAASVFLSDLAGYDKAAVMAALVRCRRELRGPLTIEAVVSRIDDGRPTADEAWALLPFDESTTVVWTTEMQIAWGVALTLLQERDRTAARLAFRDRYNAAVAQARNEKIPAAWIVSFGSDRLGAEAVLLSAFERNRLSFDYIVSLGIDPAKIPSKNSQLAGSSQPKQLQAVMQLVHSKLSNGGS